MVSIPQSHKFFLIASFVLTITVTQSCQKTVGVKEPDSSTAAVFNELWTTIDEKYALFPVKGIDWDSVYTVYHEQVTENMSDAELFKVASHMLETLKDGHVTLITPYDTATYENFHTQYTANFNAANLFNNYLKNEYLFAGPIIYKVVAGVGYIYYDSFRKDVTEEQLNQVFDAMKETKGLIIDVRNNSGGKSSNVDLLTRRFLHERTLIKYEKSKKGKGHDEFFEPEPYYLSPSATIYTNPVIILTNRSCFSACNDFVLYMSQRPNVKIYGDQTGGGGSIPQDFLLANGWKIQYSSTITLSPQKESIENGIAPDLQIFISPIDEVNGNDPILETAFQSLQ